MGTNAINTTGSIGSSNSPASAIYASATNAGTLAVSNSSALSGALTCTTINTRGSNVTLGSGSLTAGAISGSIGMLIGTLTCVAINTQNNANSAGTWAISGGSLTGSALSVGTDAISGGSGTFSGNVSVGGNLLVSRTIDYINSTQLMVVDKTVTLASTSNATDALATGAGMYSKGTNYATCNCSISLPWNTGCNGSYWLPKGGNLALPGTAVSKMITFSTLSNGALNMLNDDGQSATSAAMFGNSIVGTSSTLNLGSAANLWGTVYATSLEASRKLSVSLVHQQPKRN
jgi:hypothetical protein